MYTLLMLVIIVLSIVYIIDVLVNGVTKSSFNLSLIILTLYSICSIIAFLDESGSTLLTICLIGNLIWVFNFLFNLSMKDEDYF